jgi:molybdopterin molybdotransferase
MANLDFQDALSKLLNEIEPKNRIKILPLSKACGKVLFEDATALRDMPPYNNSALDGYAVRYEDRGKKLHINPTTIFAGVTTNERLQEGECYKIMTGAKIPLGADTIARFEDVETEGDFVYIPENIKQNDGFRVKGEELQKGTPIIKKGVRLNPSHIALLAAQGISHIKTKSMLKISVLSSGNELKEPYENATNDQFYNVNSYAIIALLKQFGFEADYGGIIPDDLQKTTQFFSDMKEYDAVISSGGVSVGEADFIKEALDKNGFEAVFTSVNLKPGKPTTCGVMDKTIVLCMPGNPLSAILNTFLFAIPCLKKMQGETEFSHKSLQVQNAESFKIKDARANVVLGKLVEGRFYVTNGGKINSGMIEPLSRSDAISIIGKGRTLVEKDEILEVYKLF